MVEPIKVICTILKSELDLEDDQVLVYNQKFDIPSDYRLYISVGIIGYNDFASAIKYENDPESGELVETQRLNRQSLFSVHIFSRDASARLRNYEVILALKSTFSQQQQEANGLSIASLPVAASDISTQDGTAILNRYALTFNVLSAYLKRKPVQYFDTFRQPQIFTNA